MDVKECIEQIIDWYFSDTVELLDLVLNDDVADPQYSAITTLNRFWLYSISTKDRNELRMQ